LLKNINMKKTLLLLVAIASLSLTFNQKTLAQEDKAPNKVLFTELGGPGVIMSMNFDSRFNPNQKLGFGYRIGAGFGVGRFDVKNENRNNDIYYYESYSERRTYYSFPAGINYIFGKPNSSVSLEVGAGATFLTRKVALYYYDVREEGHFIGHLAFMFRLAPVNGGFSFRIGFTPIIGTSGDLLPSGAIGLGYAF
jgi:hypothetical protein